MPSWQQKSDNDSLLGIKMVAVFPGNAARKMPALTSVYQLFDSGTGAQLATIAGDVLTARRTARRRRSRPPIWRTKTPATCSFWDPDASPVFCRKLIAPSVIFAGSASGMSTPTALRE
nr:hypothetical protein [Bradyrhizobium sp. BRP22]